MPAHTKWQPCANQLAALKLIQESDYELSVTALCQGVGIARATWYEYWDTVPFVKWWNAACEKHFAGRMPQVYAAVTQSALGNRPGVNTRAAKLLAERFDEGYAPKTRADVKVDSTQKTYVNVDVARVMGEDAILPEAGSDPPGAPKSAAGTPAAPEGVDGV